MSGYAARVLTEEDIGTILSALREGMSMEGAGNLVGLSRANFQRRRSADPELMARIAMAVADYELMLIRRIHAETEGRMSLVALLERRFPQRFSPRPEFRKQHLEDPDEGSMDSQTSDQLLRDAVNILLAERMEKK